MMINTLKHLNEVVTFCHGLKLQTSDGKMRLTDCANPEVSFEIAALKDGKIAGDGREKVEIETGDKVVSPEKIT